MLGQIERSRRFHRTRSQWRSSVSSARPDATCHSLPPRGRRLPRIHVSARAFPRGICASLRARCSKRLRRRNARDVRGSRVAPGRGRSTSGPVSWFSSPGASPGRSWSFATSRPTSRASPSSRATTTRRRSPACSRATGRSWPSCSPSDAPSCRSRSLPAHVKLAVLAAEDAGFYEHEGLNYLGIARAIAREPARRAHAPGGLDDHAAGREERRCSTTRRARSVASSAKRSSRGGSRPSSRRTRSSSST